MRTRALENEVFLIAASQARNNTISYKAYGHSLIVNPWGDILAEAGENECIIYADLDPVVLTETRQRLPVLSQRRPELYEGHLWKFFFLLRLADGLTMHEASHCKSEFIDVPQTFVSEHTFCIYI